MRGGIQAIPRTSQWLTGLLAAVAVLNVAAITQSWAAGSAGADRLLTVTAIVFCAALVSSIAGFAFSALAGAALALLALPPTEAVAIMLVCSIAIQAYSVVSLADAIRWRRLAPFLAGGALTVPIGVALLTQFSTAAFSLGLGILLVAYGAYMLARKSEILVKGNALADLAIGAVGGVTGGLAAFPGAFVTVWCGMRGWSKDEQRAVFQPYILVMQLVALALLQSSAPVAQLGPTALVLLPSVVLAAHLGIAVFRKLTNRQFNRLMYGLLVAAGVTLLIKFV